MRQASTVPPLVCDRAGIHVRLLRLFASPIYRPPLLPGVAQQILALAGRSDASFGEVSRVLERDPVLAGRVLSIAQSATYRGRSPLLSLQQATVRLGLGTLRSIVVEASLAMRVFEAPGYDAAMARLSWHSTVTAYLMRALCRKRPVDPEFGFLCGLLHDVGGAACLLALSDESRGGRIPFDALEPVLNDVHEEASGVVTRLWGMAPELQQLTATHHELVVGGTPHPVNALVIVAERLAAELDAAVHPRVEPLAPAPGSLIDAARPGRFEAACAFLGLDEPALRAARAEAAETVGILATRSARRGPEPRR